MSAQPVIISLAFSQTHTRTTAQNTVQNNTTWL